MILVFFPDLLKVRGTLWSDMDHLFTVSGINVESVSNSRWPHKYGASNTRLLSQCHLVSISDINAGNSQLVSCV